MLSLSIIVPVYNVEKYLDDCLKSLINQSYSDCEIILIDDGSTDGSGIKCDEYASKNKRIQVVHQMNQGLSAARNTGIQKASGDYIGFVDSDDIVDSEMFSCLMRTAELETADIVCCGIQFFFQDDLNQKTNCVHVEKGVYCNGEAMQYLFRQDGVGDYAVNKVYKKELFSAITFPKGKLFEDVFTTYKVFDRAGKVAFVDKDLYYYRYNRASLSHGKGFRENIIDFLYATKEQLEFVKIDYTGCVPYSVSKYLNACVIVYRHYASSNRMIRYRSRCGFIRSCIKDVITNEDTSSCNEQKISEAVQIVYHRRKWLCHFQLNRFIDSFHCHPRIQKTLKMIIRV